MLKNFVTRAAASMAHVIPAACSEGVRNSCINSMLSTYRLRAASGTSFWRRWSSAWTATCATSSAAMR